MKTSLIPNIISSILKPISLALFVSFHALPSFAFTETQGGAYYPDYGWADFIWGYTIEDGGAVITNVTTTLDTAHRLFKSHAPEQIPSRLGGLSVTKISERVFWCCYDAQSINIPNTVKEIEWGAFFHCGRSSDNTIKELVIPDSVEIIGGPNNGAFEGVGWRSMKSITIGDKVGTIGPRTFANCAAVNEIHLGSSLTNCDCSAFDGVHHAYDSPYNPVVHSDELSVYVKDIATWCKIDFTDAPGQHDHDDNSLIGYGGKANGVKLIADGEEVIDLVVPEGVTRIGRKSFAYYTNLLSVTFPSSLNTIEGDAFRGCSNITRVSVADIESWCNLPYGGILFDANYDLHVKTEKVVVLTIPGTVQIIKDWSFCKCSSLESLKVSDGVTHIKSFAFYQCPNLMYVTIPASVTDIGGYAFASCPALKEVRFAGPPPDNGTHEERNIFTGSSSNAVGFYLREYAEEWKAQLDSEGRWSHLFMREASEMPILRVSKADPAGGNLTLAWEDARGGDGVTYSVWRGTGEDRGNAVRVAVGVEENMWTDGGYWEADPVTKPLNYWVVAEGGGAEERESNRVETRHKYALCVGIDKYRDPRISELDGCVNDSRYMTENLVGLGGWPAGNVSRLEDELATKAAIRAAIVDAAAMAEPGDVFVYQHSSHGDQTYREQPDGETLEGADGKAVFLRVYDGGYDDAGAAYNDFELAEDLGRFRPGVAVAVIVDACHSGGLFKEGARAAGKAGEDSFDIAGRVSALMNARRARAKARGEDGGGEITASEIGWVTAVDYNELSMDGGFYHTDEWLDDKEYGNEYWDETTKKFDYPPSWEPGGTFSAGAMWGWWKGRASMDGEVGDEDEYCDAYEFWKQGRDCSVRREGVHAQCLNKEVLRSVELGVCRAGLGPTPMRTVTFDANGGSVTPDTKTVPDGEAIGELPVPVWAGHDFTGWYRDLDGGLLDETTVITASQTVYADWVPSTEPGGAVQLRVERADPAEGSLTLAWEEEWPVEGAMYSVWRGRERATVVCVANGLMETTWKDEDYWEAEPVLEPLCYWVVAEGAGGSMRESNRVETRHRHGVFVGVNEFTNGEVLPLLDEQAESFGKLARENGGFPSDNVAVLTGTKATKSAVRKALQDVAEKAQTGDYIMLFFNSHGGAEKPWFGSEEFLGIFMYDTKDKKTLYTKKELADDLEAIATAKGKNGLSVIVFMNTCYSEGAVSATPDGQDFAWIVACRESEQATHAPELGALLPHFLVKYGWKWGGAAKGSGAMATFADLVAYAMPAMEKLRKMKAIDEHAGTGGSQDVLRHFIAGRSDAAPHGHAPGTPTGLNVERKNGEDGEEKLHISWDQDDDAEYFMVLRQEDESDGDCLVGMTKDNAVSDSGDKTKVSYFYEQTFLFQVAAFNEHGISAWCEPAQRGTLPNKFLQWLEEKKKDFTIGLSTLIEEIAAAAASPSANGMSYEACYIAGVDPADEEAALRAELSEEDGKKKVGPLGGEKEGRRYWVEGKKALTEEEWTNVTGVEDLDAEGWRFFRVGVKLAE